MGVGFFSSPLSPVVPAAVSTAAVTDRTPISAQCFAAATPSAAKAFERVYGGQPEVRQGRAKVPAACCLGTVANLLLTASLPNLVSLCHWCTQAAR